MTTRREFLVMGAGAVLAVGAPYFARAESGNAPQSAVGITRVFGDGIKLIGIAVEYKAPIAASDLATMKFSVQDRPVLGMYVTNNIDGAPESSGHIVILNLSATDSNAGLLQKQPPSQQGGSRGPGRAGEKKDNAPTIGKIENTVSADGRELTVTRLHNPVVDDFRRFEFNDPQTGKSLRYNLFIPRQYNPDTAYPLVLFMHDAGVTGSNTQATLIQGLGAVIWAGQPDQAKHPSFVLAPQFDEIVADDDSEASLMLDTTIHLIEYLSQKYHIDAKRRYTTGQSGGGMLSIAMDIKYPDFFAASYLVACQWNPDLVAPMAKQKLWITVSADDDKAFPGQTAIVKKLEQNGAKVARATWNAQWSADQFQQAFDKMAAENANVNFVVFEEGSVFTTGESHKAGSGHTNTWKFAYGIEPIRDWIFKQHK